MSFIKYQHIERYETDEVDGINIGECHVQAKIDGTSGSVWFEDGKIKCASRKRELVDGLDNAGFKEYILKQDNINCFFAKYPDLRLYGEFLKSHSLKTYRDDAWGKFYIFDVCKVVDEEFLDYIPYKEYKEMLDEFDLDYIPVLKTFINADKENFIKELEQNTFLIKDGEGVGEGIVIKNYEFKNKFGRKTYAKMVTSEFKEKHIKEFRGSKIENKMIEQDIVNKFLTEAFIDKEFEKIKTEKGWSSKYIPELLSRVFHEFVVEEIWGIIKKFKNPKINFRTLNTLVVLKIKEHKKELF